MGPDRDSPEGLYGQYPCQYEWTVDVRHIRLPERRIVRRVDVRHIRLPERRMVRRRRELFYVECKSAQWVCFPTLQPIMRGWQVCACLH